MLEPAGFLFLLQLTDHVDDRLIHALHLTIGLSMVRRGSQLLHSIQFTEVCYHMARKGLPLITDKVGRCTEKPKIPNPQSLGGGTCSLVFDHICHDNLEKWSCKTSTLQMTGSSLRGTVSSMDIKSTCNSSPGPLQVRGFIGATGGAASYFLQQLHFLMWFLRSRVIPGHQKRSCIRAMERR